MIVSPLASQRGPLHHCVQRLQHSAPVSPMQISHMRVMRNLAAPGKMSVTPPDPGVYRQRFPKSDKSLISSCGCNTADVTSSPLGGTEMGEDACRACAESACLQWSTERGDDNAMMLAGRTQRVSPTDWAEVPEVRLATDRVESPFRVSLSCRAVPDEMGTRGPSLSARLSREENGSSRGSIPGALAKSPGKTVVTPAWLSARRSCGEGCRTIMISLLVMSGSAGWMTQTIFWPPACLRMISSSVACSSAESSP